MVCVIHCVIISIVLCFVAYTLLFGRRASARSQLGDALSRIEGFEPLVLARPEPRAYPRLKDEERPVEETLPGMDMPEAPITASMPGKAQALAVAFDLTVTGLPGGNSMSTLNLFRARLPSFRASVAAAVNAQDADLRLTADDVVVDGYGPTLSGGIGPEALLVAAHIEAAGIDAAARIRAALTNALRRGGRPAVKPAGVDSGIRVELGVARINLSGTPGAGGNPAPSLATPQYRVAALVNAYTTSYEFNKPDVQTALVQTFAETLRKAAGPESQKAVGSGFDPSVDWDKNASYQDFVTVSVTVLARDMASAVNMRDALDAATDLGTDLVSGGAGGIHDLNATFAAKLEALDHASIRLSRATMPHITSALVRRADVAVRKDNLGPVKV